MAFPPLPSSFLLPCLLLSFPSSLLLSNPSPFFPSFLPSFPPPLLSSPPLLPLLLFSPLLPSSPPLLLPSYLPPLLPSSPPLLSPSSSPPTFLFSPPPPLSQTAADQEKKQSQTETDKLWGAPVQYGTTLVQVSLIPSPSSPPVLIACSIEIWNKEEPERSGHVP